MYSMKVYNRSHVENVVGVEDSNKTWLCYTTIIMIKVRIIKQMNNSNEKYNAKSNDAMSIVGNLNQR